MISFFFITLVIISGGLNGGDIDYPLGELNITGSREEENLSNKTGFFSIIEKGKDIEDTLEASPGININSYGTNGSLLTPSIRGSDSDGVLILIDGIRVLPSGSSPDLSQIAQDGIERFEVLRGGGASIYGSDAVGGIINIITKKPILTRQMSGKQAGISLAYGSFNSVEGNASLNFFEKTKLF